MKRLITKRVCISLVLAGVASYVCSMLDLDGHPTFSFELPAVKPGEYFKVSHITSDGQFIVTEQNASLQDKNLISSTFHVTTFHPAVIPS
jgi:hypothetical protein